MNLHPNKSAVDARVTRVTPAADGVGADVSVEVLKCAPAEGFEDFIGAEAGTRLTLFTADPDAVTTGRTYRITARVLGGPNGERFVIEAAEPVRSR